MTISRLLTPAQVAELLAVSKSTVYAWVAEGVLPGIKLGPPGPQAQRSKRPLRFRAEDVVAFIEQGKTGHEQYH